MANKTFPLTISKPPAMKFPQGGHTDGSKKGGRGRGGPLANPGLSVPTGPSLGRLPIQSPTSGVVGQKVGQTLPSTAPTATKKPKRKGGAAFYGEM
jgi:hypothetical protein